MVLVRTKESRRDSWGKEEERVVVLKNIQARSTDCDDVDHFYMEINMDRDYGGSWIPKRCIQHHHRLTWIEEVVVVVGRLGHKATTRFDVRREIGCPTAHNGEEEEKTGLTCLGLHSAAP